MPRKLTINWILPRTGLAGGIKSNRLIAEAMVRRGHDVNLAFLDIRRPWPSPLRVRTFARRLYNTSRLVLAGGKRHHLMKSTANLLPIKRDRIVPDDVPDADVTIGTWWGTMEWIADWPKSKGAKAYFIRHYEIFGGDPDRVDATYRIPCQKLVIARWLQRLMAEKFADPNAVLVPNGVDWTQFDSEPRDMQPVPTVGIVYSWTEWKGIDTAFEAIRLAQQIIPRLRVVCFGSNPLRHSPPQPTNMSFTLRPRQRDIAALYRSADCWLMTSTSEGFGMPGLEAAACRCPIITTRCGGPEDYVNHGVSGYIVDVGDAKAISRHIVDIVSAKAGRWRAMSEASYAVARQFDWDRSAGLLEAALYKAIEEQA